MRTSKLSILLGVCLFLSGCSFSGLFAGSYTETMATDSEGKVLTYTTIFGNKKPVVLKSRMSKEATQSNATARAIESVAEHQKTEVVKQAPAINCYPLTVEQANNLKADAQDTYYTTAANCLTVLMMMQGNINMSNALQAALRGDSDIQTIAKVGGQTTVGLAQQSTAKVQAVTSFGTKGFISINARKAIQSSNESIRDVGIAAAENSGNTTVGDIAISTSQNPSADSNDGVGGSGGEGSGGSGTGSGVADANKTGDTITLNIGDSNNTSLTGSNGRAFAGTTATQQLDASANGNLNQDGTQKGVVTADENTTESQDFDDADGQLSF